VFEWYHTWYIAALSGGTRLYTSAVVPRLVHLCTDSLSMHIGTVLSAQYYVSSVVWCVGALHTTPSTRTHSLVLALLCSTSTAHKNCVQLCLSGAHNFFKIDGSSSPVCRTLCDVIVETRYATLLLLPGKPEPLFLFKYG